MCKAYELEIGFKMINYNILLLYQKMWINDRL